MARIPVLERRVGSDRLARWHALCGRYMVFLVSAHVVTIIWGYALTDGKGVVAEGVEIVFHYPEMIKGSLATLLLFGTGIVSARAARRRMRYETWYYLHLATYLAIALAFSHQIVNGADLSVQPEQTLWSAYYVLAALTLGWYRLWMPYVRDRRHKLRVHSVVPEGPGIYSVILKGERLDELNARPGQFFRLQFQTRKLRWVANPYSLSAAPHPNYLRFTVKNLGDHSAAVAKLRPGTKVRAEGPYGAFTEDKARSPQVLLIAAGRRHHAGAGPVRDAAGAADAALPGRERSGDPLPARTGGYRPRPRRPAGVLGRQPPSARQDAHPARVDESGAGSEGARCVPVRAGGDAAGGHRGAAGGRGARVSHPPRVVRVLGFQSFRKAVPCDERSSPAPRPFPGSCCCSV